MNDPGLTALTPQAASDIHQATQVATAAAAVAEAARPVSDLNSTADDLQAALTARGDHVFLASDRDRDEASGFHLYLSRVVAGERQPPEKIDRYSESGDATDPAVRMDGFDLLFSADLPVDAVEADMTDLDVSWLTAKLKLYGMEAPNGVANMTKIVSGKQLWNYDNLEPSEKKLVL